MPNYGGGSGGGQPNPYHTAALRQALLAIAGACRIEIQLLQTLQANVQQAAYQQMTPPQVQQILSGVRVLAARIGQTDVQLQQAIDALLGVGGGPNG